MSEAWEPFESDGKLAFRFPVVYVMQFEGASKIGVSVDPPSRARTLIGMSGRKFVQGVYLSGDYAAIAVERLLHSQLARYRLSGEWFSCDLREILEQAEIDKTSLPKRQERKIDHEKAGEMIDCLLDPVLKYNARFGVELSSSLLAHICVYAEYTSVDFKVSEAIRGMVTSLDELGEIEYWDRYNEYKPMLDCLVSSSLHREAEDA